MVCFNMGYELLNQLYLLQSSFQLQPWLHFQQQLHHLHIWFLLLFLLLYHLSLANIATKRRKIVSIRGKNADKWLVSNKQLLYNVYITALSI